MGDKGIGNTVKKSYVGSNLSTTINGPTMTTAELFALQSKRRSFSDNHKIWR